MVGATIKVTLDDRDIRAAFQRLEGADLRRAVLKNIGQALVKSVRARFATHIAPDGKPWVALNPLYAAGKRGPGMLVESGQLRDSVVAQLDGNRVLVGTNKVYAAIQQLGGTIVPRHAGALVFRLGNQVIHARKVTIPARPFLGVSPADRHQILEIVEDHVAEVWNGE